MFNYVYCDAPLPSVENPPTQFQTKALGEKMMDRYVIRADGTLEVLRYDEIPTGRWYKYDKDNLTKRTWFDSEPEGNNEKKNDLLDYAYQEYERVNERYEPVDFTGEFNFYGGKDEDGWLEFVATVENGKVVSIRRDHEREFRMNRLGKS